MKFKKWSNLTMNEKFPFSTDTASLVIFDVKALKHRLNDEADWWSVPSFELAEVNLGNVLIIALGQDGAYTVDVTDNINANPNSLVCSLKCPAGKVFIGAGEDISGADIDPENARNPSGRIIELSHGIYEVKVSRTGSDISISFEPSHSSGENSFKQPLELLS